MSATIIGICRNPGEPFYWDAGRIGEPCPDADCARNAEDAGADPPRHDFYVHVDEGPRRFNLFRCPKCGVLGERQGEDLVQGWQEPTHAEDDGYREDYYHECHDLGPDDELRQVELINVVQIEER